MKKLLFLYILLIIPLFAIAQFGDHFDDGNINADPEWIVNNGIYIVNSEGEMQLNDTIGGTSFVYTNVNIADSTLWEFYFRMEFAPSNSNRLRVFLSANSNDFNSDLNGYFIEIGESGSLDKITLNRLDGATETILAQSLDGSAENNPTIRVRIKRDQMGTWDLSADFSGGFDFVPFANVVDNTYPTGQFFGFQCFYCVFTRRFISLIEGVQQRFYIQDQQSCSACLANKTQAIQRALIVQSKSSWRGVRRMQQIFEYIIPGGMNGRLCGACQL